MAIEKVKTKKIEYTPMTLVQLGAALVLILLSLVFGYQAFTKWRFKVSLIEGYEAFDSNLMANAVPALEGALSWRPEHTGALELLAKIRCDENQLDKAVDHYGKLVNLGYDRPQVRAGLGVLFLKRADKAATLAEATNYVKEAQGQFKAASGIPEAAIGLGHCELVLAHKGETGRYATALQMFKKIEHDLEGNAAYRQECTREGLVDFYAGLGKALSTSQDPNERPKAAAAFKSCYQLARRWTLPMRNMLLVEAQKFSTGTWRTEDMAKIRPDAEAFRKEMGNYWKSNKVLYGTLQQPWLLYTLALAGAFKSAGNMNEYDLLIQDLTRGMGFEGRLEPLLFDASTWSELVQRDDPSGRNQETYANRGARSYEAMLASPGLTDPGMRALVHNNLGWMLAWTGSYNSSESVLRRGIENLVTAAKLAPDDYVMNRNAALAMKRIPKMAQAEWMPYYEKAKAKVPADWQDDFLKVQKYLGVN